MSLSRSAVRLVCAVSVILATILLSVRDAASTPLPALGSISVRWENCYGDGGTSAHSFACNTNTGSDVLVFSIFPPYAMDDVIGVGGRVQITTTGVITPNWWQVGAGFCRSASALAISTIRPATSTTCLDPWLGQASGGVGLFWPAGATSGELQFASYLTSGSVSLPANSEVFVASVSILHPKTVGTGSCAGCPTGACIGIENLEVDFAGGPYTKLHLPLPNTTSDVVGWQMDASMPENVVYEGPAGLESWQKHFTGCSAAVTSSQRSTWGTVKSLYR